MDLAIEANRNSALFNTMQQVLDVYNPLLHKARPTIVNQTKHRIRANPTSWANTLDAWNGQQTVRFDLPRIGSLVDFTLKCAFKIPGDVPLDEQRRRKGDRGYAKRTLTLGTITNNKDMTGNNARGRLDRIYADRLLGFNMIDNYVVSSKSRRIFSGTGEYLLVRFSQMDEDMKKVVMDSITPADPFHPNIDNMFYSPGMTYYMTIPLFMFFNEHITSALDVNFSEEVHIDIQIRPPSALFYYGQLGDLSHVNAFARLLTGMGDDIQGFTGAGVAENAGQIAWDQAIHDTNEDVVDTIGTVEIASALMTDSAILLMQDLTKRHIQGIGAPFDKLPASYGALANRISGPTFAYPDVDSLGESMRIQFEANADYIIQDTDAYRALRQQMFPEGTGLTTITFDTSQERFQNLMNSTSLSGNLLDVKSGGTFVDPAQSQTGISIGDTSRYVDLPLRSNNLVFATHFMVRKHSDLGGDGNTLAQDSVKNKAIIGQTAETNKIGAHRIYTRCLKVHYFQILAAGRVIYESDGDSHLNLTQSGMYNGTGLEWGIGNSETAQHRMYTRSQVRSSGRPFYVYSINFGLQASRLENSGCLSYQNLNNPTLRIYLKPDTWSEYSTVPSGTGKSDALVAASKGIQVDVIHEFFNVVTINSGNGEITSGLNQ